MRRVWLIASREYRQVAMTRAFWITLLLIPAIVVVMAVVTRFQRPPPSVAYTIADSSGRMASAIEARIERDYQRQVLSALSRYATRWQMRVPGAVWGPERSWQDDQQVERFLANGGLAAAQKEIEARRTEGVPAFEVPIRRFVRVTSPIAITDNAEVFGAAMSPYLEGSIETPQGVMPLALAVYIPATPGEEVRLWTNGSANADLIDMVREEMTRELRLAALAAHGVTGVAAEQIDSLSVPIEVRAPSSGSVRDRILVRSVVPLALAYLLLISSIVAGTRMLAGVIEERSNKLLESLLSCIHPRELMAGKLIGLGGIGLTVTAVWAGCALGAAMSAPGFMPSYVDPAFALLSHPGMVLAMLFYYLSGFLILSMIYLTIGAISNSMQDANSYLMPVTFGVMMPVFIMLSALLRSADSLLPKILSWVPLYTPFAMLARLGSGVATWEIIGTIVLLMAFMVGEFLLLGRIFQLSLLNIGQPPKLVQLVRMMSRRGQG